MNFAGRKSQSFNIHWIFYPFSYQALFFRYSRIILEASYSLYDKAFFDNLSTILVMAVIGTAINFLLIGFLLYFIWSIGAMGKVLYFLSNITYEKMLKTILVASREPINFQDDVLVKANFIRYH